LILVLACELVEAQNLARGRILLLPYKLLLALILVAAQIPVLPIIIVLASPYEHIIPRKPKPHFVVLELLTSLEAFIYHTISIPMHEVEPKPRAENSSLLLYSMKSLRCGGRQLCGVVPQLRSGAKSG